ncbi:MAG: type II toxin-antitoxin system RelE/ParE family toxin [Oscillospiraceae bacterium]|nr:type II toxin-antitoxin system RelE/ParE family toxin [Oscillospiraceae bacterium]
MNKYKINITVPALDDLDEIVYYIAENLKEPNIARKFFDKIINSIYKLEQNPKMYAVIQNEDLKINNYRKLIVNKYIVFYRVVDESNTVEIDRIMYGGRDWENLL